MYFIIIIMINLPCTCVHTPVGPRGHEGDLGVGSELADGGVDVEHGHAKGHGTGQERHAHQTAQLLGLFVCDTALDRVSNSGCILLLSKRGA